MSFGGNEENSSRNTLDNDKIAVKEYGNNESPLDFESFRK